MFFYAMVATAVLVAATPKPVLSAPPGAATSAPEPLVTISEAWVREAPPTARSTATYLVLTNPGEQPLVLQGVTSPLFGEVQMHTIVRDGGVSRMTQVPSFTVPAGGATRFVPGDNHLMLMAPVRPIKAGDTVPLVLDFGAAGKKSLTLLVRGRGAPERPHDHQHHH